MEDSTAPEKRGKKATQNKPPAAHAAEERIVSLPLAELHPFPNHPSKVRDDETMQETTESIRQYGVLVPAIVRPRKEGGYHRRIQEVTKSAAVFLTDDSLFKTM